MWNKGAEEAGKSDREKGETGPRGPLERREGREKDTELEMTKRKRAGRTTPRKGRGARVNRGAETTTRDGRQRGGKKNGPGAGGRGGDSGLDGGLHGKVGVRRRGAATTTGLPQSR